MAEKHLCLEGQKAAQERGQIVQSIFDEKVALISGHIPNPSNEWETERIFDGLKLVVVNNGTLNCKLPNCKTQHVSGPCVCAIWNRDHNSEGMQSFLNGCAVDYTSIFLPGNGIEQSLSGDFERVRATLGIERVTSPHMTILPATKPVRALCAQVAQCPFRNNARNYFLSGKALEITAYVLDSLDTKTPFNYKLSTTDIERLYQVRETLKANLQHPHTLGKLSLIAGMNTKKLQTGFIKIFGKSIHDYLKTLRLETAYKLISINGISISSAAYQVGYSPAHLSVVFRKEYGFAPKSIKQ